MKNIFIVIFLVIISAFTYSQEFSVKEEVIPDGPKVLFLSGLQGDYVSLSVFVKLGEGLPGIAHLGEHLIFASNSKMKAGEFDKICESFGASCDAYTNYDYSAYKLVVKKEFLPKILEYMSYVLLTPQVTEEELSLEKSIIYDEYIGKVSAPFTNIRFMLQKALYGNNYYAYPIEGNDISSITLEDLKSFYDNNYISKNLSIIICGDIDQKAVNDVIMKYYTQSKASFNIPVDVKPHSKTLYINGSRGYFGIMWSLAPTFLKEEAIACDVMSQLTDNLSSKEIRTKYKLKSVYIHNSGKWASPFTLIYQTDDIDFVKNSIISAMDRIKAGNFDEYDLTDAKSVILSDYLGKNSQIEDVTYNVGFNYVLYDYNTALSYDKLIGAVSKDDVIKMANKYFNVYTTLICERNE
ncbi:MAG: insulinase family protein [Abditibacteriota bacterium]|nr:insulinase family protein [Abditibacteriota bacterium]